MNARYDPEADALYIGLATAEVYESEEVNPGVVLDYDRDGRIIGIEFLWAREKVRLEPELIESGDACGATPG
jgi:uncharacterized protein YuzE